MTGGRLSPRNDKISVLNQLDGAFQLADFDSTVNNVSEKDKRTIRNSDPQSSEILSTNDLLSAVSYAWGCARELSIILSKNNSTCRTEVLQESGVLHYSTDERTFHTSSSSDDQFSSNCLNRKVNSAKILQENVEHLDVNENMPCPQPSLEAFPFWRLMDTRYRTIVQQSIEYSLSNRGISPNFGNIYGWISNTPHPKPAKIESKRESNRSTGDFSINPASGCVPPCTTSSCNNLAVDLSCDKADDVDLKACTATRSENNEVHVKHIEAHHQDANLVSLSHDCDNTIGETEGGPCEYKRDEGIEDFKPNSSEIEISLLAKETPRYALAKQEHAFAGAMAGIFVSLCLHPMDTIKTVIQSCPADQKPLHDIGRIISGRGISGLYRGVSSNILTSAPISAVYTFTYESVKKSLLPLLPKEYHSLAHCTAGGSASIATSFIFTPSERIKQQMQVGSHYKNCWNALIEVVHKGGFSSLYAGWGAVLCRNVPHSIIKFYTYESLKQLMLSSSQSNAQANTSVTLVCGGLAGSMASLFTTPFDVVKTRLQTQIPGSMARYNGVFNTLAVIGKREGLKGLYRGLTPRLVMYMIQGALFFASYESFKRLLSLEVPKPSTQTTRHEPIMEDGLDTLPLHVSVSA